jgi:hypothetical protein
MAEGTGKGDQDEVDPTKWTSLRRQAQVAAETTACEREASHLSDEQVK